MSSVKSYLVFNIVIETKSVWATSMKEDLKYILSLRLRFKTFLVTLL